LPVILALWREERIILHIKLVAFNLELYYAWKKYFDSTKSVEIIDGDILKQSASAIVSPANSFGYMDGGLDLKYSQHFGWELEARVRDRLEKEYYGELPVGNSIIVETCNNTIPFLILAPTMRVPSDVSTTVNSYLAFKGILQEVLKFNKNTEKPINSILCPGLATGEGKMAPELCAKQMYRAYEVCLLNEFETKGGLAGAVTDHLYLTGKSP
jgi:O-acetyl-ADP-ribose deacetylase (regulator of RNase III)